MIVAPVPPPPIENATSSIIEPEHTVWPNVPGVVDKVMVGFGIVPTVIDVVEVQRFSSVAVMM